MSMLLISVLDESHYTHLGTMVVEGKHLSSIAAPRCTVFIHHGTAPLQGATVLHRVRCGLLHRGAASSEKQVVRSISLVLHRGAPAELCIVCATPGCTTGTCNLTGVCDKLPATLLGSATTSLFRISAYCHITSHLVSH